MKIRFSVMPNGLTAPITSGEVAVGGYELVVNTPKTTDENTRAMLDMKFDVAEMSIASYVKSLEMGGPLRALPVFSSGRRFVHAGIFLSKASGLTSAEQLAGRSIGLPQYWISSCVWQRHLLERMHGVSPASAHWISVEPERFEGAPSADVDFRADLTTNLTELFRSGAIDGSIVQGGVAPTGELAELTVPAYPDIVAAEREYFEEDGVFPLMHLTVVRAELVDQEPDLIPALLDAYAQAKQVAVRADAGWPVAPLGHDLAGLRDLLGGDPWPYGITANHRSLDTFLGAAAKQGLVSRRYEVADLFVDNLPPQYT